MCQACHVGQYPLDQRLGIKAGKMSAEVVKVAARLGVEDAYGSSRETLMETTLLELSPNSIRQACHQLGEQVEDREAELLGHSQDLAAQNERRRQGVPPKRVYGSMDGDLVRFKDAWHEMKAGAFWTTDGHGRAHTSDIIRIPLTPRCLATWSGRAFGRDANLADELVFIADGAHWIWRIVSQHFPNAIQIVDWYHASSYLLKIANAAFANNPTQAKIWLDATQADLYEGRLGSSFALVGL